MTIELRKVKSGNQTFKVLNNGERPVITVNQAKFLNKNVVRLDSDSILKVLDVENLIDKFVEEKYTVVSALTVHRGDISKYTVMNVDTSGIEIDTDKTYTVLLKCRAVRYVENMAIIMWSVDEASEIKSTCMFEEDDDEVDDDDVIEPPVEEMLTLRDETISKLDKMTDYILTIRKKLSSCSISEISNYVKDVEEKIILSV